MQTRTIAGVAVSAIGLGGMPLSLSHDVSDADGIRTIHAALDAGVRLIDTADAYSTNGADMGRNERLIARALREWSGDADDVLVSTKGGHVRSASGEWLLDGRPEHLRAACEASLRALGVEAIDLYFFHRPDPAVPYADSVGALAELQAAGKVRLVGVSNASPAQIAEAGGIVELAAVQNELSPRFRSSLPEVEICEERDVAFFAWSPLGGGRRAAELGSENAAFAEVAQERGVSPQQVALAWELALSPVVIPIPGATRPETIRDSVAAADLELTPAELDRLNAA